MRLTYIEKEALRDPEVDQLLQKLLWPRSTLCREMLIGAHECFFKQFPDDLVEELEEAAICQATSVLCENAHKTINAAANHCPNGAISRQQKWHALLASPLLEEQELPYSEPKVEHKAEAMGKRIDSKQMFESEAQPFSLGDHKLRELIDNHKKLNFPGPTGYFHIGAATSALIETGDDPKKYKLNWLALLAQPGTLLWNKATGCPSLIGKFLLRWSMPDLFLGRSFVGLNFVFMRTFCLKTWFGHFHFR